MSGKDSKSAYVVPTILWDRITNELQELKSKNVTPQSGGTIVGLNAKGDVDTSALLKHLAIQQTVQQNPKSSIIGLLDHWTRQTLNDQSLSSSEKINLIESLNRAQQEQLKMAKIPTSRQAPPPSTGNANLPSLSLASSSPSTPLVSARQPKSQPPPYETVFKKVQSGYDDNIKKYAKKIQELERKPSTPSIRQSIQRSERKIQEYHERKAALRQHPKPKKLFSPT